METIKPYTTIVLEKIREKSNDLELWDFDKASCALSGKEKIIFSYIAERNTNGCLPTSNDIKKSKDVNVSRSAFETNVKKLLEKKMILNPSSVEILQTFEYRGGSNWKSFPNIAESHKQLKQIGGNRGDILSWDKKYEKSRARVYERYFIALVEKDGLPVYFKVFYE